MSTQSFKTTIMLTPLNELLTLLSAIIALIVLCYILLAIIIRSIALAIEFYTPLTILVILYTLTLCYFVTALIVYVHNKPRYGCYCYI